LLIIAYGARANAAHRRLDILCLDGADPVRRRQP